MDFEATLKHQANISISKYRCDLQVQKQQSLKMIKVQFSSVLFSFFAGRQIIIEKKRSMKLSNEKTNKFDSGQNLITTSLENRTCSQQFKCSVSLICLQYCHSAFSLLHIISPCSF